MFHLFKLQQTKYWQHLFSISAVVMVAGLCLLWTSVIGYRSVALILLLTVAMLALFFDIVPVLVAATMSALVWDFFFIPPRFTFTVGNAEDRLMLVVYFVVAMVFAVLSYRVKKAKRIEQEREERENTLKLYNTLLNSLSHELRTPISTIIGASDNLIEQESILSQENKKNLNREISIAALRLNEQVENLLNMSRLESGMLQLRKDWCDVNDIIHSVVHRLEPVLKNHRVKIDIKEGLPLFNLDSGLIENVLHNLLVNAAQYTPHNSLIAITAGSPNDHCVIMVEDKGQGFPPKEIEKVFDKFYRLNQSRTGGTGLGLSIVKGFVEANGGTISLENAPGGGAKFTIDIPAQTTYISQLKHE